MNKEKSILIEAASLLFRQRGLRNVNLADIALEAGIPLKDLRLQFHTKNEMIVALVDTALVRNNGSLQVNPLLSPTAVTELNNFFRYMENLLEEFPPAFLFQLQKFYPVAWGKLQGYIRNTLAPYLQKNLQRGILEGYYRDNVDLRLYSRMYFSMLGYIIRDASFSEDTRVTEQFHGIFRNGILNAKGIRI